MSSRTSIKNSIIRVGIGKGGMIALQFFSSIILARMLTPEDYGITASLAIFISLSVMLVDSGFGGSLVYQKDVDERDYSTVFWLNTIISIALYGVMFCLSNVISNFYGIPEISIYIKVLGLVVIFNALGHIQFYQLYKNLEFNKINLTNIICYFFASLISILLAYHKFGVWALISQQVLYNIFSTVVFIFLNKFRPHLYFSWKTIKKHWSFGSGLFFSSILKTIYDNMYLQLMSKFGDVKNAGLYNQANKLKDIPATLFSSTFETSLFPLFSRIKDNQEYSKKFRNVSSLLAFICCPLFTLMSLLATPIIKILLGSKWIDASMLLSILSMGSFFYVMESINRSGLKSKGQSMLIFKIDLFKRSLSILFICLALWNFGIYGIAYSFIFNSALGWLINAFFLSKHIEYSTYNQIFDTIKPIFISAPIAILIYITGVTSLKNDLLNIILGSMVLFLCYTFVNAITKDKSYIYIKSTIKQRVQREKNNC